MVQHHIWVARQLSPTQREALRALADGRTLSIRVVTMQVLVQAGCVQPVEGAPKLTEFAHEVLKALPSVPSAARKESLTRGG